MPAQPWIAARDFAVLLLLYGSGLRVAEALGLTGAALPLGEALSVTGKRAKTRIVPLLAPVREAIERYLSLCPWPAGEGRAAVPRRARRAAQRRDGPPRRSARRGSGSASPTGPRRTPCATASPPICSAAAPTCARSRSCSAMPACPRPRSTPPSTPPICWTSTATPIRGLNRSSQRSWHRFGIAATAESTRWDDASYGCRFRQVSWRQT